MTILLGKKGFFRVLKKYRFLTVVNHCFSKYICASHKKTHNMKQTILISFLCLLAFSACKKENQEIQTATQQTANTPPFNPLFRYAGEDYSQAVTIDFANNLIQSYLTSINYPNNDSTIRSFTFDADSLRTYLNDTTHGKIATLKFMFAHQPSYVADGNYGKNAKFKGSAMTMVVVGLDEDDRYVYTKNNRVYEHMRPCPNYCNVSGSTLTNIQ
jgi:hypothetical protein